MKPSLGITSRHRSEVPVKFLGPHKTQNYKRNDAHLIMTALTNSDIIEGK